MLLITRDEDHATNADMIEILKNAAQTIVSDGLLPVGTTDFNFVLTVNSGEDTPVELDVAFSLEGIDQVDLVRGELKYMLSLDPGTDSYKDELSESGKRISIGLLNLTSGDTNSLGIDAKSNESLKTIFVEALIDSILVEGCEDHYLFNTIRKAITFKSKTRNLATCIGDDILYTAMFRAMGLDENSEESLTESDSVSDTDNEEKVKTPIKVIPVLSRLEKGENDDEYEDE